MKEVPGSIGTSTSLAIRLGQIFFSTASLFFMWMIKNIDIYSHTYLRYLVTVMGLVLPWNLSMVIIDGYSVFVKVLPQQPKVLMLTITGDLVLSFLTLAAASSTTSVVDVLIGAKSSFFTAKVCSKSLMSVSMAFLSWFLSFASFLFNFWLLPSL